jgi:hypothetical protein
MREIIKRFARHVKGCITGFDRIVFKGWILPLCTAKGAMDFCRANKILFKDYKTWMMNQTRCLVDYADQYAKTNCGQGIVHIPTYRIDKEELARSRQSGEQIERGIIGVWSCQEAGRSFRARYSEGKGYPELKFYPTTCKHLYYYFDHPQFGFMNIRLQTWFPYHVQVSINGREWLKRSLKHQKIQFLDKGNKLLHISDYDAAQAILDRQLDVRWTNLLNGFLPAVFPMMSDVLGPHLSYYWTVWQSEWASDLIFDSPGSLKPIMDSLIRHAHITGTSTRVLRYMDRPLRLNGKPYRNFNDDISTRVMDFSDGIRLKHWCASNSVKVYNEQNVLRLETTINKPEKFKVFRHKQGQSQAEKKSRRPIRKGVADIALRAKVSQEVNERFASDLSTLHDATPVREVFGDIICQKTQRGKRYRAIVPIGKDRELLQAISDSVLRVSGITNKELRERLKKTNWGSKRTEKQLSARISRHFKLLRIHGIIRKLPNQHKYQMTLKGIKLCNALSAVLAASTENLLKIAA